MIVNYQMIVASLLHPDIDVFVSDDSGGRGRFPLHGVALNGFWVALASEVVIFLCDPFKWQSSLGWQDLE